MLNIKKLLLAVAFVAPFAAQADTIDPETYAATLAVGESVTITKTVTVEESVSTGILDVVFLIDTSGSMGAEINAAKAQATDILNRLSAFGDVASGTGFYSEGTSYSTHPAPGMLTDLTTNTAQAVSDIGAITLGYGGYGGDFPEEGIAAIEDVSNNTSWRPGSSRFIIALGDANFKESDGSTLASSLAAMDAADATFIGIDFGYGSYSMAGSGGGGTSANAFADASDGDIYAASASTPNGIADAILAGVTDSFASYDEVTVGDLGTSGSGVDVSVACVTADVGTCIGDTAVGDYDRSSARTFTFDVTFTGVEEGTHDFSVAALVDGGSVARELDSITVTGDSTAVPEPSSLLLFGLGLLGLGLSRRKVA